MARQSVAVDSQFDLPGFVNRASGFTNRDLPLYTLPITEFGRDPAGEDVNLIDAASIRAIARNLVTADGANPPYTSTATTFAEASRIEYGPGALEAAQSLADQFGLKVKSSEAVGPNTVRLTVGSEFPAVEYLPDTDSDEASESGTGLAAIGTAAPLPTEMSRMSASDIPCVN